MDLYFGISTGQGQVPVITFQNPTDTAPNANTSPNTSALGTAYGNIATSAYNFSYMQATDGSSYNLNKPQGNADMWLTFALPFDVFATNLGAQTGATIDWTSSYLAFVAFSSTQGNAVNQDVYGIGKITDTNPATVQQWGDLAYADGGGFTEYYSASGGKKPIPEPASAVQVGMLLLGGAWLTYRRRRRSPVR